MHGETMKRSDLFIKCRHGRTVG